MNAVVSKSLIQADGAQRIIYITVVCHKYMNETLEFMQAAIKKIRIVILVIESTIGTVLNELKSIFHIAGIRLILR